MESLRLKTLISEKDLQKRVKEMGTALTDRFRGQEVVAICVLKGAYMFYADLIREMECDMRCEFIGVSSYGNATTSSGEVKLTLDVNCALEGRHLLLVEDIVDSGTTLDYLQRMLTLRKPKSITTVALLHKPEAKKVEYQLDMAGFKIPNDFVVGYGLDYQNQYRELPYVAQVELN